MTRFLRPLVAAVVVWGAVTAVEAPDARATQDPSKFAAPEAAPAAERLPSDLAAGEARSLLEACDLELTTAKLEVQHSGYLRAAYIAIWLILLVFLVVSRRGQRRLATEVAELRARLIELDSGPGGKT